MTRLVGFKPISNPTARCLILGSMPGRESLKVGQYYGNARNHFWPIMGELIGAHPHLPYDERLSVVKGHGIALWDVIHSCEREGSSMDDAIREEEVNDFEKFLAKHPHIDTIYFNGQKAEQCFGKHVRIKGRSFNFTTLPSTSPANTQTLSFKTKLWRRILPD